MIFSSPRFFVFMVLLLVALRLVRSLEGRLSLLLFASCLFYAAWDWRYLGLLLLVSGINWVCGARIAAARDTRVRHAWVVASVVASLAITMLLGGLWHGASWNFVAWGGLHGAALALHRVVRGALGERFRTPRPLAIGGTLLFVMLCWVPFRSPDFATTREILRRLFTLDAAGAHFVPVLLFPCLALVALGHAIGTAVDRAVERGPDGVHALAWLRPLGADVVKDPISGWIVRLGVGTLPGMVLVGSWLLAIVFFAATGASPFIYFQF